MLSTIVVLVGLMLATPSQAFPLLSDRPDLLTARAPTGIKLVWDYPDGVRPRDVQLVEIYRVDPTVDPAVGQLAFLVQQEGGQRRHIDPNGSDETVYTIRALLKDGSYTDFSNLSSIGYPYCEALFLFLIGIVIRQECLLPPPGLQELLDKIDL